MSDYDRIADAIEFIASRARCQPALEEIAAHVHLSPFHFQRLFRRWAGISPKRFLQFLMLDYAKQALEESGNVLDATYAAGLSSPSRLHDLFVSVEAVTPGEFKKRGEGLRIGTVRRPPRGVPRTQYAAQNWYDVWLPDLAPSAGIIKLAQGATTERDWARFVKRYRAEMAAPEPSRLLALLAALSHQTNVSVGCYCADESRCHRSVLRALLTEHGARLA